MRRREPDCMRIADDKPTDQKALSLMCTAKVRQAASGDHGLVQDAGAILMPFNSGGNEYGYGSMLVCPKQCAFFAFALAHLQGFVKALRRPRADKPRAIIYVATSVPSHPFSRASRSSSTTVWTIATRYFSYNLYPGPSAKKGVYSVLLDIGEQEGLDHLPYFRRPSDHPVRERAGHHARGRFGRRQERDAGHRARAGRRGPRSLPTR